MSDDLSAFFAKKKDKKKKAAVKIEDVGQVLERRAKKQEEFEHEQEMMAEKQRNDDERDIHSEDSEWIEYGDSNQGRLEGLKLKDMGLEHDIDEADSQEPENQEVHETKTWGQISHEKKAAEESENAVTMSDTQMAAAYKPPAFRKYVPPQRARNTPINFDMSNDSLFPSLADASKIEKSKKDDAKSGSGWTKAGVSDSVSRPTAARPYTVVSGTGRENALAALKNMVASNPSPAPVRPVVETPVADKPNANSYVPPHLRNRQ